jgi:hypothetical protein
VKEIHDGRQEMLQKMFRLPEGMLEGVLGGPQAILGNLLICSDKEV